MNEQAIVVENVTKRFGKFTAVNRVSFSVRPGQVFGWLGPNGAGKTTMMRMLLGLMTPTEGSMRVLGIDPAKESKRLHHLVGYMSQQFTLYNDLTAAENIRFYAAVYGLSKAERKQREEEIIRIAGLEENRNQLTSSLSGGWRQRLALGCAIVHHPSLIFLDEPTAGVDPVSRRAFWRLIYSLSQTGTTVMVTTHYMDEAELCQKVGLMNQGNLIALDTPEHLKKTQMRGRVLEISSADPEKALLALKTARQNHSFAIDEVALYGAQVHAVVSEAELTKESIQKYLVQESIQVNRLDWITPTLEDVFISSVSSLNLDKPVCGEQNEHSSFD
jgi:ABC-2 type transport system ATP-binding protein